MTLQEQLDAIDLLSVNCGTPAGLWLGHLRATSGEDLRWSWERALGRVTAANAIDVVGRDIALAAGVRVDEAAAMELASRDLSRVLVRSPALCALLPLGQLCRVCWNGPAPGEVFRGLSPAEQRLISALTPDAGDRADQARQLGDAVQLTLGPGLVPEGLGELISVFTRPGARAGSG